MVFSLPLYRSLWALAVSALAIALATDLAYWASADFLWVDMSDWLVTFGVVVGFVALVVGLIERVASRRTQHSSWLHAVASVVAWLLAGVNMLVHTRDGWTSVAPLGLGLSLLTVLVLAVVWWSGRAPAYAPKESLA